MSRFGFGSVLVALSMFVASLAYAQEDKDKDKPAAPATPATGAAAPATFQSKQNGFTVSVPDTYEKTMESQPGLELFLTRTAADVGGTRGNLIIAAPPEPHGTPDKPLDLAAGYQAYRNMIKSGMQDMTVKEEGDAKVGGQPAKFVVIEGHQADTKTLSTMKCVVAVHNGQLFGVFGMCEPAGYEQTKRDLDQFIGSWKWTGASDGKKQ